MAQRLTTQFLAGSIPFELEITSTDADRATAAQRICIECQQLLRFLPKRRVVCQTQFGQQQVIVKLFIHPRKAARDYQQELSGYQHIAAADILTPPLISHGKIVAGGYFVMYSYIAASTALADTLPLTPDATAQAQLDKLMEILAQMHAANCQQVDLHVNNFLCAEGQLFTIDCGAISALARGNKRLKQIHKNIADVLSQLPITYDHLLPELLATYSTNYNQRPTSDPETKITHNKSIATGEIIRQIRRWRNWRMHNYQKKAARTCSEFIAEKRWSEWRVFRREYSSTEWMAFYAAVDKYVGECPRLKNGNTATVVLAECAGHQVVIKRYNIKNWRHLLSRFWRPSRGWRTWQNAQRLKVLGISTPQPVAVIEKRWGWLHFQAYYISLYTPAVDALSLYSQPNAEIAPHQLAAFEQLFNAFIYARISHGDFKANNILVDNHEVSIIDLDSMRFHRWQHSFVKHFAKDLDRFQRNWPENSHIYHHFQTIIDKLPLKINQ